MLGQAVTAQEPCQDTDLLALWLPTSIGQRPVTTPAVPPGIQTQIHMRETAGLITVIHVDGCALGPREHNIEVKLAFPRFFAHDFARRQVFHGTYST